MKKLVFFATVLLLSACAGSKPERRVETVGETMMRDPDSLRTGVYADKTGKNLFLVVENLKESQQANERKLSDLARSLDHWKRKNEATTESNNRLRVGITQRAEDETIAEAKSLYPSQETTVPNANRTPASNQEYKEEGL